MGEPERARRGAVLAATLLLLLAFMLLAHGALVLARQELHASRISASVLGARAAAEAGLAEVARGGGPSPPPGLGVGFAADLRSTSLPSGRASVSVRRLSREEWLVVSQGESVGGSGSARTAAVMWQLEPAMRAASMTAVLTLGPTARFEIRGAVDLRAHSGGCGAWSPALDSLVGSRRWAPARALLPRGTSNPLLGGLSLEEVLADVSIHVRGAGTPSPVEAAGRCVRDAPWNWGGHASPGHACADFRPARASAGGIEARGGEGQGLLVAGGDVVLRGTRFDGLILAAGRVELRDGAELRGGAWAEEGAFVDRASSIHASACSVARALASQAELLDRMVPVAGLGPLPAR